MESNTHVLKILVRLWDITETGLCLLEWGKKNKDTEEIEWKLFDHLLKKRKSKNTAIMQHLQL